MDENRCEKIFTLIVNGVGVLGTVALLVFMILKSTSPLEISLISVLSFSLIGYFALSSLYHFLENDVIEIIAWGFLYLSLILLISNFTFINSISVKHLIIFGISTLLGILGVVFNALDKEDFKIANIILLFMITLLLIVFIPLKYFLVIALTSIASIIFYFINISYMHSLSHLFNLLCLLSSYFLIFLLLL